MFLSRCCSAPRPLSKSSYPTRVRGIIVKYSRDCRIMYLIKRANVCIACLSLHIRMLMGVREWVADKPLRLFLLCGLITHIVNFVWQSKCTVLQIFRTINPIRTGGGGWEGGKCRADFNLWEIPCDLSNLWNFATFTKIYWRTKFRKHFFLRV